MKKETKLFDNNIRNLEVHNTENCLILLYQNKNSNQFHTITYPLNPKGYSCSGDDKRTKALKEAIKSARCYNKQANDKSRLKSLINEVLNNI